MLEAALIAHRVDNTPYFSVMDPTHVAEVARGVREVTPATAARFKSAGLQGIFFGHVDAYDINSGSHTERESKCVRYSSSGKHCKEEGSTNVTFYDVKARVAVRPRLVNVQTGQVVYSQEHTGTAKTSYKSGQSQAESNDSLLAKALDDAVTQVVNDVAPHSKQYPSLPNLKDATDKLLKLIK